MKLISSSLIGLMSVFSVGAEPLVEGQVRLDSGEPVANAQVRIFDMTDLQQGAIVRATTDGSGYFALPLAALPGSVLPTSFTLGQNYPNPFNPSTIIPYQLAASAEVRLAVFNLLGQRIATLVEGERPAGFHTATWYAADAAGRAVGAGVYIYRMTVGGESQTGRMVLIDGQAGVAASVLSGVAGVGGSAKEPVYGLIVSGEGLVPYMDSGFRVESGMAPVELVVSAGLHSAGKATGDDCPLCGFLGDDDYSNKDGQAGHTTPDAAAETPDDEDDETPDDGETPVTIPDANLELAVRRTLNKPEGPLTADDLASLTKLDVEWQDVQGIESLAGLKHATALDTLNLWGNQIADLSPLAGLTSLTYLNLGDNQVVDVGPLAGLTNLQWLSLWGNAVADLSPLAGLTKLTYLNLWGNQIEAVSALSGLTKLTSLDLGHNQVADVGPLDGLTRLDWLGLVDNLIRQPDLAEQVPTLIEGDVKVSVVLPNPQPDPAVVSFADITLERAVRRALGKVNGVPIFATEMETLTTLNAPGADISDLTGLEFATGLTSLDLRDNAIMDVSALEGLTKLTSLDLSGNPLNFSAISDFLPALERRGVAVLFGSSGFRENEFDIELVFLDDHFTAHQKWLIQYAANRWMAIIREDLPDYTFTGGWSGACSDDYPYAIPSGERIDDLRIYITSFSSVPDDDTSPAVVGLGGVRILRDISLLPVVGCMAFNLGWYNSKWDVDSGYYRERFAIAVLHEIAHVLGFGTIWEGLGFLQNPSRGGNEGADTHFNGPLAIAAFDDAGGSSYTQAKVPVRNDAKTGAADAHWRFSVFRNELMTTRSGGSIALSAITIQSLADLGYVVDVTQAEPYKLPGAAAKIAAALSSMPREGRPLAGHLESAEPQWTCGVGQRQEPIDVVDPQGNIIRTLHR